MVWLDSHTVLACLKTLPANHYFHPQSTSCGSHLIGMFFEHTCKFFYDVLSFAFVEGYLRDSCPQNALS